MGKKMSQRNYVNNCPKIIGPSSEAIDANTWARRQAMAPTISASGFVPDCHCEETVNKSYYLENTVKQVSQQRQKEEWLSIPSKELELESGPSTLQQLPSRQLGALLRQLLPMLQSRPSGHQIGVA